MIEFDGKTMRFPRLLWVESGGVKLHDEGEIRVAEGQDEDSYVKVLNHFGRVLKLYTFEAGGWVDAHTGMAPSGFDDHLAGYVQAPAAPDAGGGTASTAKPRRTAAAKSAGKQPKAPTIKAGKTSAKPKAATKAAARKAGGGTRRTAGE